MPCLEISRTAVILNSSRHIVKTFICIHVPSHVRDRHLCLGPDYPAILYHHLGQPSCLRDHHCRVLDCCQCHCDCPLAHPCPFSLRSHRCHPQHPLFHSFFFALGYAHAVRIGLKHHISWTNGCYLIVRWPCRRVAQEVE
jgi:hypothetical protein